MHVCHRAGGITGKYKFGARSGACAAFLGSGKMILGLLLGISLMEILNQFPIGMLGVLLLFLGIELSMASKDMNSNKDSFVMLMGTAISLTRSSVALGFGYGIALRKIPTDLQKGVLQDILVLALRQVLSCFPRPAMVPWIWSPFMGFY
eukprot:Gb_27884 [translate_table: standard]